MTNLQWGVSPYHPGRAHTALPDTDVSVCTRHLHEGQLVLESLGPRRPANLRICPECAVETVALLYPLPTPHRRTSFAQAS
ncbi:hypothetical protein HFP15_16820 [Amycolatopsis sp. K13G38]|uniref:Zinc-finger domain-containing protein n=2 Tax=Pseudonocardiaceae TaxID=2070 RepID=H5X6U6_9PSEU|nr:hypothetical protein [Amycolatopsis acididurans]EHR52375.1 hypothetical protein SacmaDRAFT_4182 [Saccharomonospora marina XMU15]NKQ54545.1 hypothetical protein [Amycolatopsis acididurans]